MRSIILCLILFFGLLSDFCAQQDRTKDWLKEDRQVFNAARDLYNKGYYNSAYRKYISLKTKYESDAYLKFATGVCAIYINDKQKEAETLLNEVKAMEPNSTNIDYYLVLLYHKTYRFSKAIELASALLTNPKVTEDDKASLERIVFYCKNGNKELQFPVNARIENLGALLNSEFAEYAPIITPEEESIIFTYRGKESMGGLVNSADKPDPNGDYNEDIMISKKVNGVWQKPTRLNELCSAGNDAAIALSPDGKQLFVFKAEGDNGDIYVSSRENGKYGKAVKLSGEVNSNYWEGSLSVSTDQEKLYFASNRPGGFGGKDLYVATKKADGTWGNVKNLGDKINTQYDEEAPFISPDSRKLIFSSEGHNSIGDFDLFLSELNVTDSTWKTPNNLGYPINTTDDDLFYFLSPDGKRGYFSSARNGGNGDQDIYVVDSVSTSTKSYITIIKGKITENGLPYETEISITEVGEAKSYGVYKSNGETGNYLVNLSNGRQYKVSFYHQIIGDRVYFIDTRNVENYAEKTVNVNFGDNTAEMQNITFGKDGSVSTNSLTITEVREIIEANLVGKYGSLKVPGLTFLIQVAATTTPEKYNRTILKDICKIKEGGTIDGHIKLLVVDKEFASLNETDEFLKKVKAAGQRDAFMTGLYNGKRYYLQDLSKLHVWDKK